MSEKLEGGIYKKILNVMEDVEYLAKDDRIKYDGRDGKRTEYPGLSEEKVTRVIREKLVKYNIVVFPIKQDHRREGTLSTVDVTYRFVDVQDGSYFDAVSSGTGSDTQDKGVGKAMTYAYKYLWLRTFAIPTGEDPDKVSSAELDDKFAEERCRTGKQKILQLLEDNAPILSEEYTDAVRLDIDTAVSKTDIDMMLKIHREVESEIRKHNQKEARVKTKEYNEQLKKSMTYNEEPPLPDSEPDNEELF